MAKSEISPEEREFLGSQIATGRRRARWKVGDLAEKSGYSVSAIQSFETGRRGNWDTFRALASALNKELGQQQMDLLRLEPKIKSGFWLTPALRRVIGPRLGPAALLDARFGIVPWQGNARKNQLEALVGWCRSKPKLRSFSIRADGGMGKTRLAVALCETLNATGEWVTGFISPRLFPQEPEWWKTLYLQERSVLLVADYAGRSGMIEILNRILPTLVLVQADRVRLLLLDRTALQTGLLDGDAWHALQQIQEGHLPYFGPELGPVSGDPGERLIMFQGAMGAFAQHLGGEEPNPKKNQLKDPKSNAYNQVLLLHMQALERVFDSAPKPDRADSILERLLNREREHWREGMKRLELPQLLFDAVEAAVARVSELGGVPDLVKALTTLQMLPEFQGQPPVVTKTIAKLLRDVYPNGGKGIAPLRPDPLYDYLANQRLIL